jgi:hypothetical protein
MSAGTTSFALELPLCMVCNKPNVEILFLKVKDAVISSIEYTLEQNTSYPMYTLGSSVPINLIPNNPMIKMNIELLQKTVDFDGLNVKTKFHGLCKECCKKIGFDQVLVLNDL